MEVSVKFIGARLHIVSTCGHVNTTTVAYAPVTWYSYPLDRMINIVNSRVLNSRNASHKLKKKYI
jgi:hypothetical protein